MKISEFKTKKILISQVMAYLIYSVSVIDYSNANNNNYHSDSSIEFTVLGFYLMTFSLFICSSEPIYPNISFLKRMNKPKTSKGVLFLMVKSC